MVQSVTFSSLLIPARASCASEPVALSWFGPCVVRSGLVCGLSARTRSQCGTQSQCGWGQL